MSDHPDRSPINSALRTRVLMGGAFFGALAAMALSWTFSWVPETPEMVLQRQAEEKAEQIAKAREEAFRAPPGSCLNWTDPEASDVHRVSCDEEHFFEVVGLADLPPEYGPDAPLPDDETWHELTEQHCVELAEDYLDKPLDPEGKLTIGILRPDERQWSQGERTLHCGLQWVGPGGGLQVLTEPAKEIDQSNVWEPGTCLGLVDKSVGDPVPCDEQHSYEIVAVVDLSDEFDSYPSREEQSEWLDPTCAELVEEYTGGKKVEDLSEEGLILGWDTRSKESWKAGSTLVNCKVGAVLEDDTGLAPVQGSVKDSEDDKDDEDGKGDEDGQDKDDSTKDGKDGAEGGGDGSENDSGGGRDGQEDAAGPSGQAPAPSGAPGSGD